MTNFRSDFLNILTERGFIHQCSDGNGVLILSTFAGFLADRYSRSRVIIVSLFVWSGVTWMTAHATTFEVFPLGWG